MRGGVCDGRGVCVCVCDVSCVMCEVCDLCESVGRALLHTVDSGPSFTPRPHAQVMIMITCGNDICGTATNTQSDIIP